MRLQPNQINTKLAGNTRRQRRRSSGALMAGGIVDGVGQVASLNWSIEFKSFL